MTSDTPDRKALSEARKKAQEAEERLAQEEEEELALLQEHRYWWAVKLAFAPELGDGDYIHPLYETAVKELPWLAYLLDCMADRRWSRWKN